MKTIIALALGFECLRAGPALAQPLCPPPIEWQRGRAGESSTYFRQFKPLLENGYVLGGHSYAGTNEHKTSPNYGFSDFHLVRLDTNFVQLWDQSFGGASSDYLTVLQETAGDGLVLGGDSWSEPGGNKTSPYYGRADFWVVGTDAAGSKIWEESFGGTNIESLIDLRQTIDGGYILGGNSSSGISGNKTSPRYGSTDVWVVRLDASGGMLWDRSFGGSQEDQLSSLQQTSDGGFILGGSSRSGADGNKTSPHFGEEDYWIIRLDADGNKLWEHTFGGVAEDTLSRVHQATDGGFVLAGWSRSWPSGNKTSPHYGGGDFWIVRLDAGGSKLWEVSAGSNQSEEATDLFPMPDGGWLVSGISFGSAGGTKTSLGYGQSDYWLVRLSATGALLWDQSYGGNAYDHLRNIYPTADGGVLLAGLSDSPDNGNKTVPRLSDYSDLWVIKLGLETSGDCDGDGVPDVRDSCLQTAPGAIVNASGCSIAQVCPCRGAWESNAEYVQCVSRVTADLVGAGTIREAQRSNIIARAEASGCPFGSEGFLIFGLTNGPVGRATLSANGAPEESNGASLTISDFGPEGQDGVTVRLGRADSGLFIYPDAPIWGVFSAAWFAEEKAFGRMNGDTHALVATIRGTKPYYETYPVTVDLSPLNPASLTFLVFSNRTLVAQATTPGSGGEVVIQSSDNLGPRVNPFWRMPDGSVGAMIEFSQVLPEGPGQYGRNSIRGPFGSGVKGDQLFIRADNPGNHVDYISRVDVTGFLDPFYNLVFLDERLGVFGRAHKALGTIVLEAAERRLRVRRVPARSGDFAGVLIETKAANRFDADLEPLELSTDATGQLFGTALTVDGPQMFAYAEMAHRNEVLEFFAHFPPIRSGPDELATPTQDLVQVKIYDNGSLAGSFMGTNGSVVSSCSLPGRITVPAIIGCGVELGSSNMPPYIALSLKQHAVFKRADGTDLRGNHLRIVAASPLTEVRGLESFTFGILNFPSFTIVGERSAIVEPPLSIARSGHTVSLTWPNLNLPFILEWADSLPGIFSPVLVDVEFIDHQNTVTLPLDPAYDRFFRLRLSSD